MLEKKMDLLGDSLVSSGNVGGYKVVRVKMPIDWDIFHCGETDNETIAVERDASTGGFEVMFCGLDPEKSFSDIFDHVLDVVKHNKTKLEKIELYDSYTKKINDLFYQHNDLEILKTMVIEIPNVDNKVIEPKIKKEPKIK